MGPCEGPQVATPVGRSSAASVEAIARLAHERDAGEAGIELRLAQSASARAGVDDVHASARPSFEHHEVVELPVHDGREGELRDVGRLERERADAHPERARLFRDRPCGESVASDAETVGALGDARAAAMEREDHREAGGAALHLAHLHKHRHAAPPPEAEHEGKPRDGCGQHAEHGGRGGDRGFASVRNDAAQCACHQLAAGAAEDADGQRQRHQRPDREQPRRCAVDAFRRRGSRLGVAAQCLRAEDGRCALGHHAVGAGPAGAYGSSNRTDGTRSGSASRNRPYPTPARPVIRPGDSIPRDVPHCHP